jgi:glycerol kinase
MDVMAEVAGLKIVRACPPDTASKGAAMLSAVALGWFKDVKTCASQWIVKGE